VSYRHRAGLAVAHASALNNILSVLALVKKEVIRSLLHGDAKEVERTDALHGELLWYTGEAPDLMQ
jgi:hypothetical protein